MEQEEQGRMAGRILRYITGWALLAAAAGTFFDVFACDGCAEGSIGLIPLYIGFPIGSVGLALVFRKVAGWVPTILAALGLGGILFFMFSYETSWVDVSIWIKSARFGGRGWIKTSAVGWCGDHLVVHSTHQPDARGDIWTQE